MPREYDYSIKREFYNSKTFNELYPAKNISRKYQICTALIKWFKSMTFCGVLSTLVPFYTILSSFYTLRDFVADLIAGITLSVFHIPQGMAYGALAGVKPINGLYTSFFPSLVYFFFGTSRHVSVGTFSMVALLTAEPINRMKSEFVPPNSTSTLENDLDYFNLKIAVTICILSGLFQLLLGIFNLGFLLIYISEPLLGGFTCGSAVHVLTSQIDDILGVNMRHASGPGRFFYIIYNLVEVIPTSNVATVITSAVCITILLLFKYVINPKLMKKINFVPPVELFILICAVVASYFIKLNEKYKVHIVGDLPTGLPSPILPDLTLVPKLLMDSVIVSIIALATTISLVKLYAKKSSYSVDYTQELNALGLTNIVSGFFRCHPASGALARTTVAYEAGMTSQVASLISCCIILLVLTLLGHVLKYLPMCVLSSIIAVSLTGIFAQVRDIQQLYHISIFDMLIWLVTALATVCIDVPFGLLTGLGFSLLTVLYRTHASYYYELGQIPDIPDIYVNINSCDQARILPKIRLFKFGGPLYYATAPNFRNWLYEMTNINPHLVALKKKKQPQFDSKVELENTSQKSGCFFLKFCQFKKWTAAKTIVPVDENCGEDLLSDEAKDLRYIIIDCSSWTFTDVVGMNVITDLITSYNKLGIKLLFTSCVYQVRQVLTGSCSLSESQFADISFLTLHDAVLFALTSLKKDRLHTIDEIVMCIDENVNE